MFLRRSIFTKAILAILLVGNVVPMAAGFAVAGIDFGSIFSNIFSFSKNNTEVKKDIVKNGLVKSGHVKSGVSVKKPSKWYSGLTGLCNSTKEIGLLIGGLSCSILVAYVVFKSLNHRPGGNGGNRGYFGNGGLGNLGGDRPYIERMDREQARREQAQQEQRERERIAREQREAREREERLAGLENKQKEAHDKIMAKKKEAQEDEGVCSVCKKNIEKGQEIVVLNCDHKYHKQCAEDKKIFECLVCAECPVCRTDCQNEELVKMSCCGAKFCKDCIKRTFNAAKDTNEVVCCLSKECKYKNGEMKNQHRRICRTDLLNAGIGPDDMAKLEEIERRKDLESFKGFRNCPTNGCKHFYVLEQDDKTEKIIAEPHECPDCHKRYCGDCHVDHPANITCERAKKTANMSPEDRANYEWMRAHTKACPKCKKRIEKNEGCDIVWCINCKTSFCWKCLQFDPNGEDFHYHRWPCQGVAVDNFDEIADDQNKAPVNGDQQVRPRFDRNRGGVFNVVRHDRIRHINVRFLIQDGHLYAENAQDLSDPVANEDNFIVVPEFNRNGQYQYAYANTDNENRNILVQNGIAYNAGQGYDNLNFRNINNPPHIGEVPRVNRYNNFGLYY